MSFKKIMASVTLVTIVAMNAAYAAPIGTGSVTGSGAFDSTINWDGAFPGTASGSVTGIIVSASVAPTLTMEISTGSLALGVLSATTATASLSIEVGTNANNGVVITAQSFNGGLKSTTASGIINSLAADGVAESYKFLSATGAASDSTVAGYAITGLQNTEVTDGTAHTIYQTNKPENSTGVNDITFDVTSSIDLMTPAASNYTDTVTFTVTGNF
ncbi:MAG: hypothetical protein PHN60_03495 [Candidatus Gracilibacteria bacterium]|nr:hypothetical protein [Candidatus Gracilibacteria bacterium]